MKSKHSDNSPVKVKGKEIKPRKKRRDAGTMVRSTAAKLAGVNVTLDMEKQIIMESEKNSFMNNTDIEMTFIEENNTNVMTDVKMDNISEMTEIKMESIEKMTDVEKDNNKSGTSK